ncbi:MAG: LPP20 family lipoprotein [Spirochaetaceae bacterium]|nr:LPP20 family lipoprotein [Spirochaetaceae bacterium]
MKIFVILIILILSISCATKGSKATGSQATPLWMTNLEAEFPNSRYLAATGSGDSRRRAQEDAAAFLAQQFTVNIKVDTLAQQKYVELVRNDTSYSESELILTHIIGARADEELINLRFSDAYTDRSGITHVVGYIERQPTSLIYRDLIRKDLAKAEEFYGRANSATGSLRRYAFYDAAYTVKLNAERMLNQLRIIFPPMVPMLEMDFNFRKIAEARDREAENLSYSISITGDNNGRIAGTIRETMSEQSISYNPNNATMVFRGDWSVSPVSVNPNFKSVQWTANISLFDDSGATIATFFRSARENAITEEQAEIFAYREFQRQLSRDLGRDIQSYLTRVVTGR